MTGPGSPLVPPRVRMFRTTPYPGAARRRVAPNREATPLTTMFSSPATDLHAAFLTHLPRIDAHARFAVRHVPCADERAELTCEVIALAWKHFTALSRRGRDPTAFVTTLALRCSQAVRAGRRLIRADSARDVLSRVARARHGFTITGLCRMSRLDPRLAEALSDNTRTPVPEQVAFRADYPQWRARFRRRDRQVLDALAAGGRTRRWPAGSACRRGVSASCGAGSRRAGRTSSPDDRRPGDGTHTSATAAAWGCNRPPGLLKTGWPQARPLRR